MANPARTALSTHWPEYLMEAAGLGAFMLSACVFGVILEHPASGVHRLIESDTLRRVIMGIAMGLTAVGIIYSPWGQRSGAHLNPSVTLAFLTLGKVRPWDAVFYIAAQFAGGIAGVLVARTLVGMPLEHSAVNYVVTQPGMWGEPVAFATEVAISMLLMFTVLTVSNARGLSRYTPLFAGLLVALYISIEAPVSGMSMNPARTFGSAYSAREWHALWLYFAAPPLGMLLAAALHRATRGSHRTFCAKLHHHNEQRCIFRCNFGAMGTRPM